MQALLRGGLAKSTGDATARSISSRGWRVVMVPGGEVGTARGPSPVLSPPPRRAGTWSWVWPGGGLAGRACSCNCGGGPAPPAARCTRRYPRRRCDSPLGRQGCTISPAAAGPVAARSGSTTQPAVRGPTACLHRRRGVRRGSPCEPRCPAGRRASPGPGCPRRPRGRHPLGRPPPAAAGSSLRQP